MIEYVPKTIAPPPRCLSGDYGTSSWIGLESIIGDILDRFNVPRDFALEFGVEHGYSLVVFSGFFEEVLGVDPFGQKTATEPIEPMRNRCIRNCAQYPNITVAEEPWQTFVCDEYNDRRYDLIHIDGEHGYYDTFGPGDWACQHSDLVLFHDTVSFPQTVMPAVEDLAAKHNMQFYNYPLYHGLGILVRE